LTIEFASTAQVNTGDFFAPPQPALDEINIRLPMTLASSVGSNADKSKWIDVLRFVVFIARN
jgi:hypothetical protein